MSILAFAVIYKFSSTVNIGATAPVIGGVTAGLLFEAAKHGFRWYVTNVTRFSAIYGPLTSVIVLATWIYYVSLITVLGAETASVYARHEGRRGSKGK